MCRTVRERFENGSILRFSVFVFGFPTFSLIFPRLCHCVFVTFPMLMSLLCTYYIFVFPMLCHYYVPVHIVARCRRGSLEFSLWIPSCPGMLMIVFTILFNKLWIPSCPE